VWGGRSCPTLSEETQCNSCGEHHNHQDCKLSEWGIWTDCSVTCGEHGRMNRTRVILMHSPGTECPTLSETRSCNRTPCRKFRKQLYLLF
jgi:hypothetical protein